MQSKTIMVAGGHGYGNAGDEAQCAETLKLLARRYPDFRVLDLTPDTDFSSREHPDFEHAAASRTVLFSHRQKGDRYKTDTRMDKVRYIWTSLRVLAAAWLLKRGLPAFTLGARKVEFLRQLSQARMLYFSGGGYLTGATQSRLWDAMLLCLLCRMFAVPVVMSGQQIGCWSGRLDRLFARWGFRSVRLIGLRDNVESQKFLEEIGVSGKRVMPTHDDALFCEKALASQVSGEPYIAASFFFWGVRGKAKRKNVLARVHDALERTRRATGVKRVVFVATLASDMEAFDMYKKLFPDDSLEAFHAVGRFREIRRVIADAKVLVTMKHHPLIFAIGEGTPVVALADVPYYVQKNLGAMGQYGIGKCFVRLSDRKWAAKFDAALGKALDRDWFLSKTSHRLEIVRSHKMSFMRKVDDVLLGDGVREELFRAQVEAMLDAQSATVRGVDELRGRGLYPSKWEVVSLALPDIEWTVDPGKKCDLAFFWSFLATAWNVDTAIAAKRDGATVVLCESGFLWAADTWANASAPARYRRGCSVVMDPLGFYFDATRPSLVERMLNDPSYEVSPDQRANAARLIRRIVSTKLTKYNHQPIFSPKIGRDGRRKVLVVDQSYGDMSIARGLANDQTFADMLEDAKRDNPDCDILVKTHPDTMTGTRKGYYDNVKEEGNVFRVTMPINPYSLLEVVDKVYVCSTQLGFEALMAGKEVHVYGMPFYAGWGLAVERQSCPRRTRRRTLEEVFHIFYCVYTHWVDVETGRPCPIDKAMDNLCALREEYMAVKAKSGGEPS